jgi:hypothetical protein
MTTRVESEEIESTRSEKALVLVLAAFMLVGAIWTYVKVDDIGRPSAVVPAVSGTPAERVAIDRHAAARAELAERRAMRASGRQTLELRREAYRTALDAGQPAAELRNDYLDAQAAFESAGRRLRQAARREAAAAPAAEQARERLSRVNAAAFDELQDERDSHEVQTGILRVLLILGALAVGYVALSRLRRQRSRYLPVALAWLGATATLALIFAVDYLEPFDDFEDAGPLVLSLLGIALTLLALIALQRYLARRVPLRRVRRQECPFCGFPAGAGVHCEGCGRRVVADCAACHRPRRVGTEHCAECGAA